METVIGFFLFFALAVLIVPLVMSITHASRLRAIEATLKKLTERLKVLETGAREDVSPRRKRIRTSSSTDSGTGRRSHARAASETAAGARQRATSASDFIPAPNEFGSATTAARSTGH